LDRELYDKYVPYKSLVIGLKQIMNEEIFSVRKIEPEDFETAWKILSEAYEAYATKFSSHMSDKMTYEEFRYVFDNPQTDFYFAEYDFSPVGVFCVWNIDEKSKRLTRLWILPILVEMGMARFVIQSYERLYADADVLYVRWLRATDNDIEFCEKNGWRNMHQYINLLDNMNSVDMEKVLKNP